MATSSFKAALARVLVHEGGYVNHPRDPGGATNQGITQRTYDAYRRSKKLAPRSVQKLTAPERDAIYRRQYWDAIKGDKLPVGVDYVVFDGAVNSGPNQSIKWLQRALGSAYRGQIDGVIGLATFAALEATEDHDALIDRISDRRMAFLKALEPWPVFAGGWTRRVQNVRAIGKAAGRKDVVAVHIAGAETKATIEDARKAPSPAPADAATGGGIGAGGIAGTLQTLQDQLTPFSAAGNWITTLVVVLAVSGAGLAAGGIAYRWYAKRRAAQLADALDAVPA
ncbi:N-acetylmuramidase [Sinorhizobium medicae]|uniref:glycoside hydrolase family 108 protein n=1 Tax=Sinorhizobium medicae TaxID=110321 RepID=UPI00042A8577|nr:glycoside hydrolase family 108 protein [Sinorhizobium medicae]MDX0427983.1 N-acetylmuramidase [Sinorhizobium medicae]MDX0987651.1 N-acetylmuramidase [Sinorhizobium medicae]MDX1077191.1 N-acetylmuramidase [Sinorhizobium medicae]